MHAYRIVTFSTIIPYPLSIFSMVFLFCISVFMLYMTLCKLKFPQNREISFTDIFTEYPISVVSSSSAMSSWAAIYFYDTSGSIKIHVQFCALHKAKLLHNHNLHEKVYQTRPGEHKRRARCEDEEDDIL